SSRFDLEVQARLSPPRQRLEPAAHGLPCGDRQRRVTAGRAVHYRDVDHLGLGTTVELDGRLGTSGLPIDGQTSTAIWRTPSPES
ncbi:MAG TPA: hypothetical protein VFI40_16595, partial [Nocardioides sp.]|nr:hypothetical protein [Nocardioides sp.]